MNNFEIIEEKFKRWEMEPPQRGESWDSALAKIIKLIEYFEDYVETAENHHWS